MVLLTLAAARKQSTKCSNRLKYKPDKVTWVAGGVKTRQPLSATQQHYVSHNRSISVPLSIDFALHIILCDWFHSLDFWFLCRSVLCYFVALTRWN